MTTLKTCSPTDNVISGCYYIQACPRHDCPVRPTFEACPWLGDKGELYACKGVTITVKLLDGQGLDIDVLRSERG